MTKAQEEHGNGFFTAIIMGDAEAVRGFLPQHPEALGWLTPGGYTPLQMAILNRREDIAAVLVEHGADMRHEAMGETPEALARKYGMIDRLRRAEEAFRCESRMHEGLAVPLKLPRKPPAFRPR